MVSDQVLVFQLESGAQEEVVHRAFNCQVGSGKQLRDCGACYLRNWRSLDDLGWSSCSIILHWDVEKGVKRGGTESAFSWRNTPNSTFPQSHNSTKCKNGAEKGKVAESHSTVNKLLQFEKYRMHVRLRPALACVQTPAPSSSAGIPHLSRAHAMQA